MWRKSTKYTGFLAGLLVLGSFSVASSAGSAIKKSDFVNKSFCLNNIGTRMHFNGEGTANSNQFGDGKWSFAGGHLVFASPTVHLDLVVTKEPGNIFHYTRWGGDGSQGDATFCQ